MPWMDILWEWQLINCCSGNAFTNYALYAFNTSITSCFREKLVDCIYNQFIQCQNAIYGKVDPLLYHHETNIFVKSISDHNIISYDDKCDIAFDNVNITIVNTTTTIILSGYHGNIMLIDSYIMDGFDILSDYFKFEFNFLCQICSIL